MSLQLRRLIIYPPAIKPIGGGHREWGHRHLQATAAPAAAIIPPQFREAANSRTETGWPKQPTEDIQHQYLTGTSIYTTQEQAMLNPEGNIPFSSALQPKPAPTQKLLATPAISGREL